MALTWADRLTDRLTHSLTQRGWGRWGINSNPLRVLIKTSFFWWVFNRRKTLENIDIFYLVAGDLHDNLVNAALLFLWVFVSAQLFFFFFFF